MNGMGGRHALKALGAAAVVVGACSGGGANRPLDRAVFESKPAGARTLPPLESRLQLVQGYQRAGAASGITVVRE